MTAPELQLGEASALRRVLPISRDPLSLSAALTDRGERADTLLLEDAGGRAFIFETAALRAACRGAEVTLTALSSGGRLVLKAFAWQNGRNVTALAVSSLPPGFPSPDETAPAAPSLPHIPL